VGHFLGREEGDVVEDPDRAEHRRSLVQAEHVASRDFDKAIITLAGGAFG
jgi:hypothetical protein